MDAFDRIMELTRSGLYCAQIMVQLALDAEGAENPGLVEAARGLCCGYGWSGGPCGALGGGVCFLNLLASGLDSAGREALTAEFHNWFRSRTEQYGGEGCDDILGGDRANMFSVCPAIIMDSYAKCVELLEGRGLA